MKKIKTKKCDIFNEVIDGKGGGGGCPLPFAIPAIRSRKPSKLTVCISIRTNVLLNYIFSGCGQIFSEIIYWHTKTVVYLFHHGPLFL